MRLAIKNNEPFKCLQLPMRLIYSILLYLLSPIILLILLQQAFSRQGGLSYVLQRLGFLRLNQQAGGSKKIWFHAASVGEVAAILPLLQQLGADTGGVIAVSVNTPEAMRRLEDFKLAKQMTTLQLFYLPCDFYYATRRCVGRVGSTTLAIVETELWPNLIASAKASGCRVVIVNGRLSNKTLDAPSFLRRLYAQTLYAVDLVAARSEADASKYVQLGLDSAKAIVAGNLKRSYAITGSCDSASAPSASKSSASPRYVLVISSREEEELLIWRQWRKRAVREKIVFAPRHIRRVDEICQQLGDSGASVDRLSLVGFDFNSDVLIVDQMGMIEELLDRAAFAIVGGSFAPFGGHNVLEPAFAGRFVVVGPYTETVDDDVSWLQGLGAIAQISIDDLASFSLSEFDASLVEERLQKESADILTVYQDVLLGPLANIDV